MINRPQAKRMGDNNDVKTMLENMKIVLIGKIDALSDKLDGKKYESMNLKIESLYWMKSSLTAIKSLNFLNVVWMTTNSMVGEQALELIV